MLKRTEDIRVGDLIVIYNRPRRVLSIEPYSGALSHILHSIARFEPGPGRGISLERGAWLEVLGGSDA